MIEIIRYSLKNLVARKSRSLLTILSIFIGITAIFIFASFGVGLYGYVEEVAQSSGIDKFFIQARGMGAPGVDTTFKLEDKDLRAVERSKGVKSVAAWYLSAGEIEKDGVRKYVFLAGVRPISDDLRMVKEMMGVDIEKGRDLRKSDTGKVTLGNSYSVPDRLFADPYEVGDKIEINGKKFDIVGIWESIGNPGDDANIYILEDDIKGLFEDELSYGAIIGEVYDVNEIDSVVARVEKNLRKVRNLEEGKEDFFVQSFASAIEMFSSVINIVVGFIMLIVIISAFVASINTANTMITSVLERIKEIGIMKSVGATNATIRNIFLFESTFLGLAAGLIGVGVGWMIATAGGQLLTNLGWGFLTPRAPWWLFVICIVLAVGVGAISGLLPAAYAAKQKPVDALHYE